MNQRATLLEGSLDDIELANVVQTVSVSRRSIALELREPGGAVFGTLVLKAGQIVSAASEGLSGIDALRKLVIGRRPGRFLVYRASGIDLREHVGPVADLLSNVLAAQDPSARDDRSVLAQGSLDTFELRALLEALSLGRQSVGIEVFASDGKRVGALYVKGGQVLSASSGRDAGELAARDLLEPRPAGRFVVFRVPEAARGEPLLSVRALLSPPLRDESLLEVGDEDISEEDAEEMQVTQVAARPEPSQPPPLRSRPPPLPSQSPPPIKGGAIEARGSAREPSSVASRGSTPPGAAREVARPAALSVSAPAAARARGGARPESSVPPPAAPEATALAGGPAGPSPPVAARVAAAPSRAPAGTPLQELAASTAPSAPVRGPAAEPRHLLLRPKPDSLAVRQQSEAPQAPRANGDAASARPPREAPQVLRANGDTTPGAPPREAPQAPRANGDAASARPQSEAPQPPRFRRSEGPAAAPQPKPPFVLDPASDAAVTARHPAARARTPIIAVTSPKGGAGRTTLTLNLAVSLARRGRRVVVVDADASSLLPTLNVADRPFKGVADVLEGRVALVDTVLETRVPGLKLIPSGDLSDDTYRHPGWQPLLATLAQQADLVLVDCAPGWYGATLSVLAAASHQLLVLAAEPAARRVCAAYQTRLEKLLQTRPELLGLVINMLDYQVHASVRSLEELSDSEYAQHVFDIPIPRSPAFMEASARGVPIVHVEQGASPTIAWVFETLATALLERLLLEQPVFASAPLLA